MNRIKGFGKQGMALAVILTGVMTVCTHFFIPASIDSSNCGLCLPSPDLWQLPTGLSWALNMFLLAVMAAGLYHLNRHFNFIRTSQPVFVALFLILVASNPWISGELCASMLVCFVNLVSTTILLGCYRQRNATQQMFVIATFISIGSMCQYAFLPYIIAYVAAALVMKSFRFKELIAFGMGLAAPYWILLGFGVVDPAWFRMPELKSVSAVCNGSPDTAVMVFSVGVAVFLEVMFAINNSLKLYAGNSKVNAMNLAVIFMGLVSAVFIIVDFSNMEAYLATLFLSLAVQVGNLCALWKFRNEWAVAAVPALVYMVFYSFFLFS